MPVDAIGGVVGNTAQALNRTSLSQEDFLKLFLTELNFQDPLEPLNNREFLAQMAQFSALEQSRQATENMESLIFMNSTAQSISLLNKRVEISTSNNQIVGTVTSVQFSTSGPLMTVTDASNTVHRDIRLSQINRVIN